MRLPPSYATPATVTKLSVNINKLALLRNSREKNNPNLILFGRRILELGAHGLTVHPRPDGRHIRREDLRPLAELVREWDRGAEFNIEGYPSEEFFDIAHEVRPHQCTLVPDPPEALTSNAGWDFVKQVNFLTNVVGQLKTLGTRVSLFLDPATFTKEQEAALATIAPDRVELYTEAYADAFGTMAQEKTLQKYVDVAVRITELELGINAGHDLTQKNLGLLARSIPHLKEVSIGHALVCEALDDGFEKTIKGYLSVLEKNGARD